MFFRADAQQRRTDSRLGSRFVPPRAINNMAVGALLRPTPTPATDASIQNAKRDAKESMIREIIAKGMIAAGFATGHGDTAEDLLNELWPQIADLQARLERAEADKRQLERAFNIRLWNEAMNSAWHKSIPDVEKAFYELKQAAMAGDK